MVCSQSHLRFTRNCNTDANKYNERAKNGDGAQVTAPFKVASNTPTHRRMLAGFDAIHRSDSVAWNASRYLLPSISKTVHNTCIFFSHAETTCYNLVQVPKFYRWENSRGFILFAEAYSWGHVARPCREKNTPRRADDVHLLRVTSWQWRLRALI